MHSFSTSRNFEGVRLKLSRSVPISRVSLEVGLREVAADSLADGVDHFVVDHVAVAVAVRGGLLTDDNFH